MDILTGPPSRFRDEATETETLFRDTFAASDGPDEGAQVGALVREMLQSTPDLDLVVHIARDGDAVVGGIFLSRLRFAEDPRVMFILSPVAVSPTHQRRGTGQALIAHGLDDLRDKGVDYVVTYGDPAYYVKSGFAPIPETFAPAPLPLSMPQGWLGQPLSARGASPFSGPCTCIPALARPALW